MERGCITYSIAYLTGIIAAGAFPPHILPTILAVALLVPLCIIYRKNTLSFIIFSHLALFSAGAGGYSIAKVKENLPNDRLLSVITSKASDVQQHTTVYLKNFASLPNNHAILCALTIGEKKEMAKNLKNAYSKAGALHILALSGLHVGIMYSILQTLMYPLKLVPTIKWLADTVFILFILLYVTVSGCSPSVVRAGTMIVIYKIGKLSFRDIRKWDSIALSALILGVAAPLQVNSIGFQLSYAAVIGISCLYPICRSSFKTVFKQPGGLCRFPYVAALKLWENISISVCCQIATLPILLYHFGESAQYFLITNLVAIPLATAILYIFVLAVTLQWIPFVNTLIIDLLNTLINIMNNSINNISS